MIRPIYCKLLTIWGPVGEENVSVWLVSSHLLCSEGLWSLCQYSLSYMDGPLCPVFIQKWISSIITFIQTFVPPVLTKPESSIVLTVTTDQWAAIEKRSNKVVCPSYLLRCWDPWAVENTLPFLRSKLAVSILVSSGEHLTDLSNKDARNSKDCSIIHTSLLWKYGSGHNGVFRQMLL